LEGADPVLWEVKADKNGKKSWRRVASSKSAAVKAVKPTPAAAKVTKATKDPRQLRPHQTKVVDFLLKNRGVIALHSTGSGKTLTSIASARALLAKGIIKHAIALVNKSIIEQFWEEVRTVDPALESKFTVTTPTTFTRSWKKYPVSTSLVIIDEAHQFANEDGMRTKIMLEVARQCPRILLLTGTLVRNKPGDICPLVAMVRGEDPMHIEDFNSMDTDIMRSHMKNTIAMHLIDKNKDEHYPTVLEHVVKVPSFESTNVGEKQDVGGNKFLAKKRRYGLGACTDASKLSNKALRQCCEKCGWIIDRLSEWIKRGEKTVLFASMVDTGARTLQQMLINSGINCRVIDGTTHADMRQEYVKEFNMPLMPTVGGASKKKVPELLFEGGVPVFIITMAGAESIDLKGVRHIVFLNALWTWAAEQQIIGRAQRYNSHAELPPSKRNVNIWKLQLVGDTADVAMDRVTRKKETMAKKVLKIIETVTI
jgi:SNF2 family DNA or RNA helicase